MRSKYFIRCCWTVMAGALLSGCQTGQLRVGSINQAASYGDIQEQQVLDNLAKFVYDINSLPTFAYSGQGNNQVTDQVSIGSTTTWQRIGAGLYGWLSSTATPTAQRQAFQNWVLQPLNDPRKLDLMRCAYQKVVRDNFAARGLSVAASSCTPCDGGQCPDCTKRFNSFYTGDANTLTPPPGDPKDRGGVTPWCLGQNPTWFGWGCKSDLPKACKCLKYGHYCGVYVWVLPGGEDELTKLTLAILDYAVNTPAQPVTLTKQVTYNVGLDGKPALKDQAVGTVTGTLPIGTPSIVLLKADLVQGAKELENQIKAAKAEVSNLPANHPRIAELNATMAKMMVNLSDLQKQAATIPALPVVPAPYRPSIDEIGGLNLLQFQNRLQSIQPVPSLVPPPS
jgi:hypothetical protein